MVVSILFIFFFSSRRRHTRYIGDWSSDVCSSDLRGNADYTIEEPVMYPFTYSSNAMLKYINRTLVKAKPEFHKKTFLKAFHQTDRKERRVGKECRSDYTSEH